ncbi:unnamed protein product [Moneuplotes crassus]|uniref:Uncharacterized protein n=1 Tax=Euplotes crassus TaxID=5936 RepID=A0AAD1TZW5_EUPCR|nr:unnamed protein product [Moneuplotes crassus]
MCVYALAPLIDGSPSFCCMLPLPDLCDIGYPTSAFMDPLKFPGRKVLPVRFFSLDKLDPPASKVVFELLANIRNFFFSLSISLSFIEFCCVLLLSISLNNLSCSSRSFSSFLAVFRVVAKFWALVLFWLFFLPFKPLLCALFGGVFSSLLFFFFLESAEIRLSSISIFLF